ncbi:hypothetical protein ABK040_000554 [Willaertia magna]
MSSLTTAKTSSLIIGGGSGFFGKQLIKHLLIPNKLSFPVPFTPEIENLKQITIVSRNIQFIKEQLEKELPNVNRWDRKDSIQVLIKDWKSLNNNPHDKPNNNKNNNENCFLFNHQIATEKDLEKDDNDTNGLVSAINLSGVSISQQNWTEKFKRDIYSSRIETTKQLMSYLNSFDKKANVFIGTSAVGYYPSCSEPNPQTPIFTEYNCNQQANNPFGELCGTLEKVITEEINNNIKKRVIMRPGVIIGKGGGVLSKLIVPYVGVSLPIKFGTGSQPFPIIHIADLANLYIHALFKNSTCQPLDTTISTTATATANNTINNTPVVIYNGVCPDLITFQQLSVKLNERTNWIILPLFPISFGLTQMLMGKERALLLCEGQYVMPTRSLEEGFNFVFPSLSNIVGDVTTV